MTDRSSFLLVLNGYLAKKSWIVLTKLPGKPFYRSAFFSADFGLWNLKHKISQ